MILDTANKAQSPLDEARQSIYGALYTLSEEQQNEIICSVTTELVNERLRKCKGLTDEINRIDQSTQTLIKALPK